MYRLGRKLFHPHGYRRMDQVVKRKEGLQPGKLQ